MAPAEQGSASSSSSPSSPTYSPMSQSVPWETLRASLRPPDGSERMASRELLEYALRFHAEHKVVVAGRYLAVLESRGPLPKVDAVTEGKLAGLRLLCQRVCELRASLEAEDGWEVQRDSDGIRCLYQAHDSGFVRVRLDAQVNAPMFDLLALLREVELWPGWMPSLAGLGLTDGRHLGEASILNMCFRTLVHTPWPIKDRTACFAVDGVDCMDPQDAPQQVVVLLDSRYAQANCREPISAMLLPGQDKAIEVCMLDSGVIITPAEVAGTEHTLMQVIFLLDPKMVVPRWLVNLAVRNLCFLAMVQIRRAVAVTRQPAHLRITTDAANPFYAFIRRRLGESLPRQLALAPPLAAEGAPSGTAAAAAGKGSSGWMGCADVLQVFRRACSATCGPCLGRKAEKSAVGAGNLAAAAPLLAATPASAAATRTDVKHTVHWAETLRVFLAMLGSFVGITVLVSQVSAVLS